jgi:uncharacterized protein (UPF0264 family)
MSEWNQLNATFQLIYLEFDNSGLLETKYRNTVLDTLSNIQKAIRDTDARMQLLSAGIGASITETEEGPMSIWEALQQLQTSAKLSGGIVDGHHLYLDELRLKLPNWGAAL